ncbi:TonB-dependent receptor domain-containing protein [Sphaerotilus mobilis]|uniref:Vitamin B12 transporter n=1 Tax=Sphaerotilus mobilis TaxID=47994 RepID=A0A4Q7LT44_9BURK|nr:TonB-dependent receptor [Sphaerotilus mobilis]RZS58066.1 vitamin B12 transporter [Sphaerotilus mobilis]
MSSTFRTSRRPAVSSRLFVLAPLAWAAGLCASGAVQAQADLGTRLALADRLPQVVITASRMPQRIDQAIADVTVIDRDQIDRSEGLTLAELIARQAGVQLSSNGGLGKASAVFMRGLEGRHVLLLVDGVRYGSATLGEPDFANLPLAGIERIEIVRGPMSGLYGSDAVGGVIQVFTRQATPGEGLRVNARSTAGSHGHGQVGAGLSFAGDGYSGGLQLLHTEEDGYSATNAGVPFGNFNPDRDGINQNAARLHLRRDWNADWSTRAQLLQVDARTQYDDGPGADALASLGTQVSSLEVEGRVLPGWRSQWRFARSVNDYGTLVSAPTSFNDLGTIHTDQRTLAWENVVSLPLGSLVALVDRLEQRVSKPVQNYDVTRRTIQGLALGYNLQAGDHSLQTSLRRDLNSQFGGQTTGSAGYGYAFTPSWQGHAQVGTSFVAPSFNQLYWPGFGNALLLPERGRHAELGIRHVEGDDRFGATLYANRIRGYITEGANPVNLPYSRSTGLTLQGEQRWGVLNLSSSVDLLRPVNDSEGNANEGKLLPRRAQRTFKLSADVDRGAWRYGTSIQAHAHRYDDAANLRRLAGYATVDLHSAWSVTSDWQLSARLNNLADRTYETARGFNQAGRALYVGVRYSPR